MYTIEEIHAMSPAELEATNRRLGRKLLVNRVLLPVAIVTGYHVLSAIADRRSK